MLLPSLFRLQASCVKFISRSAATAYRKLKQLRAMGKTTYTAVTNSSTLVAAAQQERSEAMPDVPKASTFASSPKKKANQRTSDAAAYLCVAKVCSDATLYKDDMGICLFPGITSVNQNVFLVTLSHPNAYPQMDFKIAEKIDAMLKANNAGSSSMPCNWIELMEKLHIVAVNTGTFVPYNLPYKNWQRAFYVAGDATVCQNFVMEIDNCIVYTVEHHDKPKFGAFPLKVQMGVNVGFQVAKEDFDYPLVEVTHDMSPWDMAVTPLQVYPPSGVRPLVLHFEVVNANEVAMTFFGDTYRHRSALDYAGLEKSREEPPAASEDQTDNGSQFGRAKKLETFYMMASKDVSVATEAAFVKNLLTVAVENVVIDFRLTSTADEGTASCAFIESLKTIPSLLVHEA